MCGIAGVFCYHAPGSVSLDAVPAMTKALEHRGPDAEGYFRDGPVHLGHRRLAIIDPDAVANQPFTDASGRYVLVYNGEIYNFRQLREQMPGQVFRTQSDTEVLLECFIRQRWQCPESLSGMFAFALWDKEEQQLYLCRDRFGVKPLYYYAHATGFAFASEIRSLLCSGMVPRKLDMEALHTYLGAQSFHSPETPIAGIRQVEPGSWLVVSSRGLETRKYWTPADLLRKTGQLPQGDPAEVIRQLLEQAVARRLVSDVPVAAFLSGGIDSSLVVGMMSSISAQKPATFTLAFDAQAYDESPYAEIVAKHFHTHHTTIRLGTDDVLSSIHEALDRMDIPSGDGINTYLVSRAVSGRGIRVALSGVGGDELFGRYPFFQRMKSWQKWQGMFDATTGLRRIFSGMLYRNPSHVMQRVAGLLSAPSMQVGDLYPELRRILSEPAIGALTKIPLGASWPGKLAWQEHRSTLQSAPLFSQISMAEYGGYTSNTLLKDTDQMGMARSLEIREPFFDHELVAYMMQLPDAVKCQDRELVRRLIPGIPEAILHRPKQGFLFPWQEWMKGPLRGFCEEKIKAMESRRFIRGEALRDFWNRFLRGDARIRWTEPWLFIVLEHWMEKNHVEA